MTRSHSPCSRSKNVPPWLTPAQSSSTSSRPNARTVVATAASTAPRSRTSSAIAVAWPPLARIRAATASAAAASMSAQTTDAPSRAKPSLPAPPMPPPAPATSATFPSRRAIVVLPTVQAGDYSAPSPREGAGWRAVCRARAQSNAAGDPKSQGQCLTNQGHAPQLRHSEHRDTPLRAVGVARVRRQWHVHVIVGGACGYRVHGSGTVLIRTRRYRRHGGQRWAQLGQGVYHRPNGTQRRADWVICGSHVVVPVTRVVP